METKSLIWLGAGVGSMVGGMIPELWGADFLSFSSVLFSAIGGMLGIWGMFTLTRY